MEKPILLLKQDLIKPIEQALERIEKIRQLKASNTDSIILEGLFILAISSFENSLNDTLRILLMNIPDKLDFKSENISKEELIDGNPLKQAVENKIISISYKNLTEIQKFFAKTTGLNETIISETLTNELLEIKATRNLLIHNNLVVNSIYKETAGINQREPNFEKKLIIDQNYLFSSLTTLRDILNKYKIKLLEKYSDFTRINAIKKLFRYIFNTPVMQFENEFEVDEENDIISTLKNSSRKNALSSSEKFYYDIWLAHSHGTRFEFNSGQFYSISNKDKLSFFMKNIDLLKSKEKPADDIGNCLTTIILDTKNKIV
ncbi:hypothetical protein [Empedobacter tilapiae]|uniref:Uncharacterized protein n=1 Tax=Empedobacter tilapiae TaxID=2491114 RepID=A0A4Z1BJ06_9FLAO|nr:hypothetical protein [Empedobacter tilapiae]TGN29501.1 hypothetical protein E4J94_01995 [Empedobacter tilapiae]